MNKVAGFALLLSVLLIGCAGSSEKPDDSLNRIRQAGTLLVATDPSYPPFSFLDAQGQLAGYDVDLSREVASRLGVKASFVGIDVTSVFDALIAKKADAAISAVSPAWEYAKQIGFSRSYFNAGQVFLVRRDSPPAISPQELMTATVGVEIGSTGELEGRKLFQSKPGISITPFDSVEVGMSALSQGKVDTMITDRVTAALLLKQQSDLRIAGEPFTYEPYVIAIRASDRTLLKEVDDILNAMTTDGFLDRLDKRWLEAES